MFAFNSMIQRMREIVADYVSNHGGEVNSDMVNPLSVNRVLDNWTGQFTVPSIPDGTRYEIVYNGHKHEFYLSVYKFWESNNVKDIPVPADGPIEPSTDE